MTNVSVKKSISVEASQQRAFRVFTEGMDRWWPRDHHIGTSPMERMVVEPRTGGRWYALSKDRTECDIGRVLAWEPYGRVLFAWQITSQWQFDPSFSTEVEITFTPEGPRKTRVELEHRNLERYGDAANDMRKAFESDEGWNAHLHRMAKALSSPKYLMIYESTPESRKNAPGLFAAHNQRLHDFHQRGKLLMAGPVMATGDAYGIFTTKEAAEEFVAGDPFVSGGVVTKHSIVEWMDVLD